MDTVRRLRAMASLCRQTAAYRPDRSWKLLAEAEFWEHLADAALLEHFKECTASSLDAMPSRPIANANDSGLTAIAVA
ncbi:hypothetical protein JQ596_00955 [Bradyrhizobium manausense]|uniref:hypothetical protein n=1 Tax=Bradyrhizobium TaxID=374 RepID=UPI001BAC677F|nr:MULTISPECIES: hypothetical protein [Bradyrhizobium]MBR0824084.1 hypothetical protein [Bradyrhizobium manausense]UVO26496.1 hypothetical protein KUF59_28560 [Bradyrhizobium arachidis]